MHDDWQNIAHDYYLKGNYARAIELYEKALVEQPEQQSHYWFLGLLLLLQGQVAEAQTTWFMAVVNQTSEQVEELNRDLAQLLEQEAVQQEQLENNTQAYLIRQQLYELYPNRGANILHCLKLALELKCYDSNQLAEALPLLQDIDPSDTELSALPIVVQGLLDQDSFNPQVLDFISLSKSWAKTTERKESLAELLLRSAVDIGYLMHQAAIAERLCRLGLQLNPNSADLAFYLSCFCQEIDNYEDGIRFAELYLSLTESLPDRIAANKNLVKALLVTGGHWDAAQAVREEYQNLLAEITKLAPNDLTIAQIFRLFNACFFGPYCQDSPVENRSLQNRVIELCQNNLANHMQEKLDLYAQGHKQNLAKREQTRKLRIGYLSYCLKSHSVGWLARSLIQHHDRERFELYIYLIATPENADPIQDWYMSQAYKAVKSSKADEMAEVIFQDEIDVLIELDSMTIDSTCIITSLKPAPVQVTWLGWDASGISKIDHFVADPYVLPEGAESYYRENIYRLPNTYLAVDGFEVDIPTLRREMLGVSDDAILYYSAQKGYKRHPETMRLQLEIIKAVPNSYLLIKGSSGKDAVQEAFYKLADDVGVAYDRLRFLDVDLTEAVHRANLGIADIVLDTYPYNGATTTMETLWMGIPLVTRVGQQFSARNSYTMLMNVGVEEGIAWSAEEYVEWGIRFGTDAQLRQKVVWQLSRSRRTAPLWNGRQFARNMEAAYLDMWNNYCQLST
ncbi:MAG: O-linked N-acetylglucosamine transferase, SPINDLY family protein [Spirulinaceae cyanobacterium RM2_2_10]|nr:O-linked N-acetylglucosamine transferase, SPINDLY family protein [Spirulinaceae cyanobacterium SM2_1_0]NJO18914.1 O-linked N-acetylglucosamine transferase, SPINDLY family protein [Spirulinaceae cyanobacterium RM2_2_10]